MTIIVAGCAPAAGAVAAGLHAAYRKLTERRRWNKRCNAPWPA